MKLSVIIPVYNVEEYIEKCILSLQHQDIPKTDYELIITNDGSPDNSLSIIRNLKKSYSNIILIDQENQGVSIARNNALAQATGDYIMSIDPDDYVLPDTFGRLIKKVYAQDIDVLYLGFEILDENGETNWSTSYNDKEGKLFSGVDAYFATRGDEVRDPDRSVAIMYKRSLLKDFKIHYPENVPYLEDGLFLGKVFSVAERCAFDASRFYMRTTRMGSATHSKLFYTDKAHQGFIKAAADIRNFREENSLSKEQSELVNHVIAKFILLPVTSCVGSRNWGGYRQIKQNIREAGFEKLNLQGCRSLYHKYAWHFNKSTDWFFFYYFFQMMFMSVKYRLQIFKKKQLN